MSVPGGNRDVDTAASELISEFARVAASPNAAATLTFRPVLLGHPKDPHADQPNYAGHPRMFRIYFLLETAPSRGADNDNKLFAQVRTYRPGELQIMSTEERRVDLDEAEDMLADAMLELPASLQPHWFGEGKPAFEAVIEGKSADGRAFLREHRYSDLGTLREYLAALNYGARTVEGSGRDRARLQRAANEWLDWIERQYKRPVDRRLPMMEKVGKGLEFERLAMPRRFNQSGFPEWHGDELAEKLSWDSRKNHPLLPETRDPTVPPYTREECDARLDFLGFHLGGLGAYLTLFGYPPGELILYHGRLQQLVQSLPPAAARAAERAQFVKAAYEGMHNMSQLWEALQQGYREAEAKCLSVENVALHPDFAPERESGYEPRPKRPRT